MPRPTPTPCPPEIAKMLGKTSDNELSRLTGYSQVMVSAWRRRLGIPVSAVSVKRFKGPIPHRKKGVKNAVYVARREFIRLNWPSMSDAQLAAKLKLSVHYIGKIRSQLGLKLTHRLPKIQPQGIIPRLIKASSKAGQKRE